MFVCDLLNEGNIEGICFKCGKVVIVNKKILEMAPISCKLSTMRSVTDNEDISSSMIRITIKLS